MEEQHFKKAMFVEAHQSFIKSDTLTKMKNLKTKYSAFRNLAFKTT